MMVAEQLINGRVIAACQQGDRAAFQLLFETYKDKVFSIAVYSSDGDRALQHPFSAEPNAFLRTVLAWFKHLCPLTLALSYIVR